LYYGNFFPGKFHTGRKGCHFPRDGFEHLVTFNFEVLMNINATLQWIKNSQSVPVIAVEGGKPFAKEPLYVIRCHYKKDSSSGTVWIPGWFQQSDGRYIGHASKKIRCEKNKWKFLTCVYFWIIRNWKDL